MPNALLKKYPALIKIDNDGNIERIEAGHTAVELAEIMHCSAHSIPTIYKSYGRTLRGWRFIEPDGKDPVMVGREMRIAYRARMRERGLGQFLSNPDDE